MNKDNGTRTVARIRVDPDDPTQCGRGPDCDGFLSLPREALQCGLFKSKTWGKGSHFRCPACFAAEVKVDEDKLKEAFYRVKRFIQVIFLLKIVFVGKVLNVLTNLSQRLWRC